MKKYFSYLLALCCLTSCERFLDVKPKAEIVEHIYFDTPEGFEDALYGAYSSLSRAELYGEHLSWGLVDGFAQYYKKTFIDERVLGILTLDHERNRGTYGSIWNRAYESIGYVNNVLRNLDRKDPSSMRHYNLYKGEALGLRAFLHFDLVRLFAPQVTSQPHARGIPYVKIYEASVSPFKTVSEVYALIIDDLLEAEKLLEADETLMTFPRQLNISDGFATSREIHFNRYAVQALLARVYWMKNDMDNAAIYAEKVISSGKFQLEDKLDLRTFAAGTISSSEAIFGVYATRTLDGIRRAFYTYEPTYTWLPADDLAALYSVPQEEGNDMRGNNWFRILITGNDSDNVLRCMKIVNEAKITNPSDYTSTRLEGINMIRLSEMYLIAAEAWLTRDPIRARDYFDTFIESRGLFKYADRPQATFSKADIIRERRKEFVQEGQYFYTMKRENMDIYVDAQKETIVGNDELYQLLIPDEEFEYRQIEEDES